MKKTIVFTMLIALLTGCASKTQTEEVCVKFYMLGGHVRTGCYDLPKGAELVNTNEGVIYYVPGFFGSSHRIKRGAVDFDIISRK